MQQGGALPAHDTATVFKLVMAAESQSPKVVARVTFRDGTEVLD